MTPLGYDYQRDSEMATWGWQKLLTGSPIPTEEDMMGTPNPLVKTKGAGTTFWLYTGSGDAFKNPLADDDWLRLAGIKICSPEK